ncbi:MAG: DNA starvation/stationary phase protection protein [Christiangramia sp.]|nr:DNA starvation/stationary phase protection protein [Christiangramia sp.]|tara:strand:- start:474 stop:1028 length:555 start_codon:yes stop_codon:yes gene_type:complete
MKKLLFVAIFLGWSPVFAQQPNYQNSAVNAKLPLTPEKMTASTEALQATLYELIDQKHAVHQAHWNLRGPQFISLHELLEELYGDLSGYIDAVAERKLALGQPADGRPTQAGQQANLGTVPEGFQKDHEVVASLTDRYQKISERLGKRIDSVAETDAVSQDLLIGLRNTIDLHLWKLRSFTYND